MGWLRFRLWLDEMAGTAGPIGSVVFEEVRRHAGTAAAHVLEVGRVGGARLAAEGASRQRRRAGQPHCTPPRASIAHSSRARASASLSSAGAKPRARMAAITASFGALPLPVAKRLIVPTGTPW